MSLAVRGTGCTKQGVAVEGVYRTYNVKVVYTGRVEVFIPLDEDTECTVDEAIGEIIEEFPEDIGELSYYTEEYEEV